jgi:hypothetical protein
MIKQPMPPKKQMRRKSVSIKTIDFRPGSKSRDAAASGRGAKIPRRIKVIPNGRLTDFFETVGEG